MKARCPQKYEEEVEQEQQEEEEEQRVEAQMQVSRKNTENVGEKYTVGKRKKREENVNSPPKSPLEKRKENIEETQCVRPAIPKGIITEEKISVRKRKEDRREIPTTTSERDTENDETPIPGMSEENNDGKREEIPKGKHIRTMINY
ncbi:eukaryotic translation initiation factor 3 subunit J-A-like [Octopus bimaculoides]|uniref:eukaryotic translation initiation factor 3 subunit J-A-like n=1 Tax=Octopus bimaculoides TaxID=37653 RepID=UPI00071D119B|nr:eukaryotic translation initiation factor 3 subunit J-A-like [Octopus bimaculoides]|eukprot:XP_014774422.1 PREDICTED: eukaryotic translation initiation factor 3 subunit J-A-like [Octopus bimaculoides]